MSQDVERGLIALESENLARKSSYPVAGSLVAFDIQRSATFSVSGGGNTVLNVRVKFTPSLPSSNGKYLINLSSEVYIDAGMSARWPRTFYWNEPQAGDGTLVIRIQIYTVNDTMPYYFRVTASGTSGGSFAVL